MKKRSRVSLLLCLAIIVSAIPILGLASENVHVVVYPVSGSEYSHFQSLLQTGNGYTAVGKYGTSSGTQYHFFVKYDNNFNIKSTHEINDFHSMEACTVEGGFIAFGARQDKARVVKYDDDMNLLWAVSPSENNGYVVLMDVAEASDGYVIAGFYTYDAVGSGRDEDYVSVGVIYKYDKEGNLVWKRTLDDHSMSMVKVSNHSIYAVGGANVLFKLDMDGNEIWKKDISNSRNDTRIRSMLIHENEIILVGGLGYAGPALSETSFIYKLDTYGNEIWYKDFGGSGDDIFNYVFIQNDSIIAIGRSNSIDGDLQGVPYEPGPLNNSGLKRGIMVVFDSSGNIQSKEVLNWHVNENFISMLEGHNVSMLTGNTLLICGSDNNQAAIAKFTINFSGNSGQTPSAPAPSPTPPTLENLNGWQQQNGNWYYYTNNIPATGWQQLGGSWYYLDTSGIMQTGWLKEGNTWFYLESSGKMAAGWNKIGGSWYYLSGGGRMLTGWQKSGTNWYYLKSSGAMATGWQQIGGSWYWFNSSGAMVTGTQQIGGKTYRFSNSGAWIR